MNVGNASRSGDKEVRDVQISTTEDPRLSEVRAVSP